MFANLAIVAFSALRVKCNYNIKVIDFWSYHTATYIKTCLTFLRSLHEEDEGVVPSLEDQSYMRREWTPVPVNTHLTEQSSNTPTRPFADLKLTEAEIKSKR